MQSFLDHPQLGRIELKVNPRAKRFIFRASSDGLTATIPARATQAELMRSIDSLLPKLLKMIEHREEKKIEHSIDARFQIVTDDFRLHFRQGIVPRMQARFSNGILEFVYPSTLNFNSQEVQDWIVRITEEALRHQSKKVLIPRLQQLANKYSFSFAHCSIHKTHGRWGSCSSKGNINLSLYLVLLPRHLQEYVMLHELCHTRHMDHSPRFWALLDQLTSGKCENLRSEMKKYDTSIFYLR